MKIIKILLCLVFVIAIAFPTYADDLELVKKIDTVVSQGPENGNYFVGANDVYMWLKMKKTDFLAVDVRIGENALNVYKAAHIPGAIYIPYNEIFKPENLQKLPKDKKIIFVCHMGASEALLIVPMRMLGYDAYGMLLGMAGWQKDYPAAEYVQGLIDAPKTKNYPLESGKSEKETK
ncbi:MAG: rhodanese-like domain-containing protein [Nitrospirae bacterium]|nr:rhodanese-like domain-containing protein [Nitrospirota bacterium]